MRRHRAELAAGTTAPRAEQRGSRKAARAGPRDRVTRRRRVGWVAYRCSLRPVLPLRQLVRPLRPGIVLHQTPHLRIVCLCVSARHGQSGMRPM